MEYGGLRLIHNRVTGDPELAARRQTAAISLRPWATHARCGWRLGTGIGIAGQLRHPPAPPGHAAELLKRAQAFIL